MCHNGSCVGVVEAGVCVTMVRVLVLLRLVDVSHRVGVVEAGGCVTMVRVLVLLRLVDVSHGVGLVEAGFVSQWFLWRYRLCFI